MVLPFLTTVLTLTSHGRPSAMTRCLKNTGRNTHMLAGRHCALCNLTEKTETKQNKQTKPQEIPPIPTPNRVPGCLHLCLSVSPWYIHWLDVKMSCLFNLSVSSPLSFSVYECTLYFCPQICRPGKIQDGQSDDVLRPCKGCPHGELASKLWSQFFQWRWVCCNGLQTLRPFFSMAMSLL